MTAGTLTPARHRTTSSDREPAVTRPPEGDDTVILRCVRGGRTVLWGAPWHLGSAAYWVAQVLPSPPDDEDRRRHALGTTLEEEVAACLLGGHGVPAAVGLAAYGALRETGMLYPGEAPTAQQVEAVLRAPVVVHGRPTRYRFASQRAARLADSLAVLAKHPAPKEPLALRAWLLNLPGVGPKTASWVVRNRCGSDQVAIVDIHVLRAGVIAGIFDPSWTPARHYDLLEELFLAWARQGSVSAADLDAVVWAGMARLGHAAARTLGHTPGQASRYFVPSDNFG